MRQKRRKTLPPPPKAFIHLPNRLPRQTPKYGRSAALGWIGGSSSETPVSNGNRRFARRAKHAFHAPVALRLVLFRKVYADNGGGEFVYIRNIALQMGTWKVETRMSRVSDE